jgi:hypothetical protein
MSNIHPREIMVILNIQEGERERERERTRERERERGNGNHLDP